MSEYTDNVSSVNPLQIYKYSGESINREIGIIGNDTLRVETALENIKHPGAITILNDNFPGV